jgi:WD40 repeat protein
MTGRLDLRKWIQVYHPAYAVVQSNDGRYVAVGTETGVTILDSNGHGLADYPSDTTETPIHQLCASPDFTRLILATRLGSAISLELKAKEDRFELQGTNLYTAPCDIHRLAMDISTEYLTVGHLSSALIGLNFKGKTLWQQKNQGTAALGTTWSVDFANEGKSVVAGSAGTGANWLAILDAATGALLHKRECASPVTSVTALVDDAGIAALTPGEYYTARLTVYSTDLNDVLWEQELDGPGTALTSDSDSAIFAVASGFDGKVQIWDATGGCLAAESLRTMVNGLSLVSGNLLAAATQDGNVALLRYLP